MTAFQDFVAEMKAKHEGSRQRRNGAAESTPGTLAASILAAGRKRRNEVADAEPAAGTLAAAIVLAGKKRRGEI
ncbi:MAG: hypothetical protein ABSA13_10400 [Beijerinckiaceae bacterium]|jgi:hypothetical protein